MTSFPIRWSGYRITFHARNQVLIDSSPFCILLMFPPGINVSLISASTEIPEVSADVPLLFEHGGFSTRLCDLVMMICSFLLLCTAGAICPRNTRSNETLTRKKVLLVSPCFFEAISEVLKR